MEWHRLTQFLPLYVDRAQDKRRQRERFYLALYILILGGTGIRVGAIRKERQHPRTRRRQKYADRTHVQHGYPYYSIADLESPVAAICADGLSDQCGSRHRDPHGGHVAEGSEHHDNLARRAIDGAEAYLHQLKQRKAENIRRNQQTHWESQFHLAPQSA